MVFLYGIEDITEDIAEDITEDMPIFVSCALVKRNIFTMLNEY